MPLTENYPQGKFYVCLGSYFYSKSWVIYSLSLIAPKMAQPYTSELRGFNLDDKKDILITRFHDTGVYSFAVASDKNLILFSQKYPGPGVTYLKQVYIFDLTNGQKYPVDTKDLKVVLGKDIVEYSKDGLMLTFHLQQSGSTLFALE